MENQETEKEEKNLKGMAADPGTEESQEVREFNAAFYDFTDNLDYEIKLYRVVGVKRTKKYLRKYESEIPDEEMIGNMYGGGKFAIMGVHPTNGKLHTKYFDIDEIFDRHAARLGGRTSSQLDLNSPISSPISQLKELSEIMKNLGAGPAAQPLKMMEGITEMFTNGLKKIQNVVIDQQIDRMKQQPENENEKSDLSSILELINTFGNKFLEARGPQENLYKQVIKSDPKFQEVSEDDDLIVELYETCCQDPEIGKDKINKIMEKLGIEVPQDIPMAPNIGSFNQDEIKETVRNG